MHVGILIYSEWVPVSRISESLCFRFTANRNALLLSGSAGHSETYGFPVNQVGCVLGVVLSTLDVSCEDPSTLSGSICRVARPTLGHGQGFQSPPLLPFSEPFRFVRWLDGVSSGYVTPSSVPHVDGWRERGSAQWRLARTKRGYLKLWVAIRALRGPVSSQELLRTLLYPHYSLCKLKSLRFNVGGFQRMWLQPAKRVTNSS